jgi:secreted trypsin-like serine protease
VAALGAATSASAAYAPRIVGGSSTTISQFPFQVALVQNPYSPAAGQICGGSVRDATHVITAAHCVTDGFTTNTPSELDVFAGATSLSGTGQRVHLSGISFMPSYDPNSNDHDAALLTLAQPLSLQPGTVEPIDLIADDQSAAWQPGSLVTVSGWGNTSAKGQSYPLDLHAVQVPVVDDPVCDSDYQHYGGIVAADMVCAGDIVNGGKDSCQGDSGGPLVADVSPSTRRLIGIVSFGIGCADKDFPGVYTEVASPSIRSYLTAAPPPAPTNQSPPSATGTLKAGQTLTCNPGTWTGSPTFRYQFGRLDSLSDTTPDAVSNVQTSSSYTIQGADAGKYLICAVEGRNAGGSATAQSAPVGPVEVPPAPQQTPPATTSPATTTAAANPGAQVLPLPQFDYTPPVSRLYRAICGKRTCTLNIAVTDAGYSLGLQKLEGTIRTSYRVRCRRGRRIVHCTRIKRRTLTVTAAVGGHFIASAKNLRRGTHTFRFVAVDTAGNRQSPALSFKRRTPAT